MADDRIMEIEHGSVVNTTFRKGIERILVRRGFQAQRPLVQVIVGAAILGLGCLFIFNLIKIFTQGGPIFKFESGLAGLVFLGGWLMWNGLKQGYYLEVTKGRTRNKFAFRGQVESNALNEFIKQANERFGYQIDHPPLG